MTDRSTRVLPLTAALAAALRRAQSVQKAERLALGPDYGPGEDVVCDAAGRPYHPDTVRAGEKVLPAEPPVRIELTTFRLQGS